MRRVGLLLSALAAFACEPAPVPVAEQPAERATRPPQWTPPPEDVVERPDPNELPAIPGLLLEKLAIEREGSFTLPEGSDEISPHAVVAISDGLAFVGQVRARGGLDPLGQSWRWIGVVANEGTAGEVSSTRLDTGSIHAAISDGKGGALLAGTAGSGSDARGWFGVLDARGAMTLAVELDGDAPPDMVDVLAGHGGNERALLLGNVGTSGGVVSIDARGGVRWQGNLGDVGSTQIHAGTRVHDDRGEVLTVGTRFDLTSEAWWSRLAGRPRADVEVEQGKFEIDSADAEQSLDAIVDLGHDMGFIALGTAKRQSVQEHDQVFAVGFDRTGQPTWGRVLDHFRAMEIYGGTVHHGLRGVGHFLARVPIGGEGRFALAWIEICPGVDGVIVTRQLAGTSGWESAGFIEGRDDGAILAYERTEAGVEWKILLVATGHVWG